MTFIQSSVPILLLFVVASSFVNAADQDKPRDGPKEMLRQLNGAMTDGDAVAVAGFFRPTSAEESSVATAEAEADAAVGSLGRSAADQWGTTGAAEILAAIGGKTPDDVDRAAIDQQGDDAALVHWPHDERPLKLVRVAGAWRIDVGDLLARGGKSADERIKYDHQVRRLAEQMRAAIVAGAYGNPKPVADRIRQRLDELR